MYVAELSIVKHKIIRSCSEYKKKPIFLKPQFVTMLFEGDL